MNKTYLTRKQIREQIYRNWLINFSKSASVALTVTFRDSLLLLSKSKLRNAIEDTVRHLLKRIDKRVYRHGVRRKG